MPYQPITPWTDTPNDRYFRQATGSDLANLRNDPTTVSLHQLMKMIQSGQLSLQHVFRIVDPDVLPMRHDPTPWVDSLLTRDIPIPPIHLYSFYPGFMVLDGLRRLRAWSSFLNDGARVRLGGMRFWGSWLRKEENLGNRQYLRFADLELRLRRRIIERPIEVYRLESTPGYLAFELYRRLHHGQPWLRSALLSGKRIVFVFPNGTETGQPPVPELAGKDQKRP